MQHCHEYVPSSTAQAPFFIVGARYTIWGENKEISTKFSNWRIFKSAYIELLSTKGPLYCENI